jgi:antirestriction protein ArdC
MTTIYGDAVPTPNDVKPWAAVLYSDSGEIKRAAADSRAEAEALVAYFLEKLAAYARLAFENHAAEP